jgi:hypothetical protein
VTGVPPTTVLDDSTTLASATVVGAVVVVESAQPPAATQARSARPARRLLERAGVRVTDPIVSRKYGQNVTRT